MESNLLEKNQAQQLLGKWKPELKLESIEALTPDASGRIYFRLFHQKIAAIKSKSSIVMKFASLKPPEVGGREGPQVLTDAAVVMLTRFFRSKGVTVPELYLDARDEGYLLIEDLGNELLGDAIFADKFTSKQLDIMFRMALEQLARIQAIEPVEDFFIFERSFTKEVFLNEMSEYSEFFLPQFGLSSEDTKLVDELYQTLSEELLAMPQVLCHRDYHAWNLLFDKKGSVRVIDFQDSLVGPRAYDLASLLNDRDMDAALGDERRNSLISSFSKEIGAGPEFLDEYHRVLLQRDLKVAGRFEKFAQVQGMERYKKWIPGTSKRIFRTLRSISDSTSSRSSGSIEIYRKFLAILDQRVDSDELKA